MINDNSNDARWPKRKIVATINVEKTMPDAEPSQQIVALDCGHWCYNTYGGNYIIKLAGEILNCRTCYYNAKDKA